MPFKSVFWDCLWFQNSLSEALSQGEPLRRAFRKCLLEVSLLEVPFGTAFGECPSKVSFGTAFRTVFGECLGIVFGKCLSRLSFGSVSFGNAF